MGRLGKHRRTKILDLGIMRQRISVYSRSSSSDNLGGQTQTDALVGTYWCKVRPLPANELLEYGMRVNDKGYEITMRYNSSVTINEDVKIVYNGLDLLVNSVLDDLSDRKYYKIIAHNKG